MLSGLSLQSVATLLVYACQRIGRANGLNYLFALGWFHFPEAGGGVFREISAIGGGAFGICMPACREGDRTERFVYCACAVPFSLTAGQCFRGISTIGSGAFGIICMSASREGELSKPCFFLRFSYSIGLEWGGDEERVSVDPYSWRRRFWYTHVSVSEGRAY